MRFARIPVSNSFSIPDFGAPSALGSVSQSRSPFGDTGVQPIMPEDGIFSDEGTETIGQVAGINNEMRAGAARDATRNKAEFQAAKIYSAAQEKAADKMADAKKQSGIFSTVGKVIGTALPLIACDMRLKHDAAPLECAEVTDELADLAFAVKALRECS